MQDDPRFRLGQDVAARRRGHAVADQPFAIADLTGFGVAGGPTEAVCALRQAIGKPARREFLVVFGVLFWDVAQAQRHRVDARFIRQLVHRVFQRQHADRLSGRAHGAGAGAIHPGNFVDVGPVFTDVKKVCRQRDRLAEILAGQV